MSKALTYPLKSRRFEVRLTDQQRQKLTAVAAARKITPSEAIRLLVDEAASKTRNSDTSGLSLQASTGVTR